jgi:flagellin
MATINPPISGLSIPRQLELGRLEIQKQIARIASAGRITRASEGPAELAISERLRSQISALGVRIRGVQDVISMRQIAEGALGQISDIAQRIGGLSVRAATGTLTAENRQVIQEEIGQLRQEIGRIARETRFNVQPAIGDLDLTPLEQVSAVTQTGARRAVEEVGKFIETVSARRAGIGAEMRALESRVRSLSSGQLNLIAAESRIRGLDVGEAIIELRTSLLRQQIGISSLADVLRPGAVLDLLG